MTDFVQFRHKSSGILAYYPEDYENHPVFGPDLERYNPEEFEEDKVVSDNHTVPAEQRTRIVANEKADKVDDKADKNVSKENKEN